jgi:hypothetical protein
LKGAIKPYQSRAYLAENLIINKRSDFNDKSIRLKI